MIRKPQPKSRKQEKPAKIIRGKDELQTARPDIEWFDAQLDRRGLNRTGLSVQFDPGAKNWLNKILMSERRMQLSEVAWVAKRLGVPGAEIIRRLGYDLPGAEVPVIGTVTAHSRISIVPPLEQDKVPAPPGASERMVALRVEADQSALSLYSGVLMYYVPCEKVRPDSFGRICVCELGDSAAPIVGCIDRASLGRSKIILLDGKSVIETAELEAAAPIEWTKTT